jgi:hypothetical protein
MVGSSFNHLLGCLSFALYNLFQRIKDHTVHSLSLSVSPWVRHRNVLDNYASVIAEVPEIVTGERGPQVGDDAIRQAEAVDNLVEQLSCLLRSP